MSAVCEVRLVKEETTSNELHASRCILRAHGAAKYAMHGARFVFRFFFLVPSTFKTVQAPHQLVKCIKRQLSDVQTMYEESKTSAIVRFQSRNIDQ